MSKISVIVPTYNEEKYIEATLESVRNQDYNGDFEIIVVDGDSKDNTVEVARKYADRIIISRKRGTGVQRDLGAKHAKGEFLAFIDADTILPKNYLSKINKIFKEKKYVAFCGRPIFSNNRRLKFKISNFLVNAYFTLLGYIGKTIIHGHNFCISKNALNKVGGFGNFFVEDYFISKRLRKLGKLKFLNEIFVINSSRRIEQNGILNTMNYYISFKRDSSISFHNGYVKVN